MQQAWADAEYSSPTENFSPCQLNRALVKNDEL